MLRRFPYKWELFLYVNCAGLGSFRHNRRAGEGSSQHNRRAGQGSSQHNRRAGEGSSQHKKRSLACQKQKNDLLRVFLVRELHAHYKYKWLPHKIYRMELMLLFMSKKHCMVIYLLLFESIANIRVVWKQITERTCCTWAPVSSIVYYWARNYFITESNKEDGNILDKPII